MMNAENNLLDQKYGAYLTTHICERCGVSNILVELIQERKQRLCPWCVHWLGLSESMREVIIDPKSEILKTMKGNGV